MTPRTILTQERCLCLTPPSGMQLRSERPDHMLLKEHKNKVLTSLWEVQSSPVQVYGSPMHPPSPPQPIPHVSFSLSRRDCVGNMGELNLLQSRWSFANVYSLFPVLSLWAQEETSRLWLACFLECRATYREFPLCHIS